MPQVRNEILNVFAMVGLGNEKIRASSRMVGNIKSLVASTLKESRPHRAQRKLSCQSWAMCSGVCVGAAPLKRPKVAT